MEQESLSPETAAGYVRVVAVLAAVQLAAFAILFFALSPA
jgi:hypothetical protein